MSWKDARVWVRSRSIMWSFLGYGDMGSLRGVGSWRGSVGVSWDRGIWGLGGGSWRDIHVWKNTTGTISSYDPIHDNFDTNNSPVTDNSQPAY